MTGFVCPQYSNGEKGLCPQTTDIVKGRLGTGTVKLQNRRSLTNVGSVTGCSVLLSSFVQNSV